MENKAEGGQVGQVGQVDQIEELTPVAVQQKLMSMADVIKFLRSTVLPAPIIHLILQYVTWGDLSFKPVSENFFGAFNFVMSVVGQKFVVRVKLPNSTSLISPSHLPPFFLGLVEYSQQQILKEHSEDLKSQDMLRRLNDSQNYTTAPSAQSCHNLVLTYDLARAMLRGQATVPEYVPVDDSVAIQGFVEGKEVKEYEKVEEDKQVKEARVRKNDLLYTILYLYGFQINDLNKNLLFDADNCSLPDPEQLEPLTDGQDFFITNKKLNLNLNSYSNLGWIRKEFHKLYNKAKEGDTCSKLKLLLLVNWVKEDIHALAKCLVDRSGGDEEKISEVGQNLQEYLERIAEKTSKFTEFYSLISSFAYLCEYFIEFKEQDQNQKQEEGQELFTFEIKNEDAFHQLFDMVKKRAQEITSNVSDDDLYELLAVSFIFQVKKEKVENLDGTQINTMKETLQECFKKPQVQSGESKVSSKSRLSSQVTQGIKEIHNKLKFLSNEESLDEKQRMIDFLDLMDGENLIKLFQIITYKLHPLLCENGAETESKQKQVASAENLQTICIFCINLMDYSIDNLTVFKKLVGIYCGWLKLSDEDRGAKGYNAFTLEFCLKAVELPHLAKKDNIHLSEKYLNDLIDCNLDGVSEALENIRNQLKLAQIQEAINDEAVDYKKFEEILANVNFEGIKNREGKCYQVLKKIINDSWIRKNENLKLKKIIKFFNLETENLIFLKNYDFKTIIGLGAIYGFEEDLIKSFGKQLEGINQICGGLKYKKLILSILSLTQDEGVLIKNEESDFDEISISLAEKLFPHLLRLDKGYLSNLLELLKDDQHKNSMIYHLQQIVGQDNSGDIVSEIERRISYTYDGKINYWRFQYFSWSYAPSFFKRSTWLDRVQDQVISEKLELGRIIQRIKKQKIFLTHGPQIGNAVKCALCKADQSENILKAIEKVLKHKFLSIGSSSDLISLCFYYHDNIDLLLQIFNDDNKRDHETIIKALKKLKENSVEIKKRNLSILKSLFSSGFPENVKDYVVKKLGGQSDGGPSAEFKNVDYKQSNPEEGLTLSDLGRISSLKDKARIMRFIMAGDSVENNLYGLLKNLDDDLVIAIYQNLDTPGKMQDFQPPATTNANPLDNKFEEKEGSQSVSSIDIRNEFLSIAVSPEDLQKKLKEYIQVESPVKSQADPTTFDKEHKHSDTSEVSLGNSDRSSSSCQEGVDQKSEGAAPVHEIESLFNLIYFCAERECAPTSVVVDQKQLDSPSNSQPEQDAGHESSEALQNKAHEIIQSYANNPVLAVILQKKYNEYISKKNQSNLKDFFDDFEEFMPFLVKGVDQDQFLQDIFSYVSSGGNKEKQAMLMRNANLPTEIFSADKLLYVFNFYFHSNGFGKNEIKKLYLIISCVIKGLNQANFFGSISCNLTPLKLSLIYLYGELYNFNDEEDKKIFCADNPGIEILALFFLNKYHPDLFPCLAKVLVQQHAMQQDAVGGGDVKQAALDTPSSLSAQANQEPIKLTDEEEQVQSYLMLVAQLGDQKLMEKYFEALKELIKEKNYEKIIADKIRFEIAGGDRNVLFNLELLSDDFILYLENKDIDGCKTNSQKKSIFKYKVKALFYDIFHRIDKAFQSPDQELTVEDIPEFKKKIAGTLAIHVSVIFNQYAKDENNLKIFCERFNCLMDLIIAHPKDCDMYVSYLRDNLSANLPSLQYYNHMLSRMCEIAERHLDPKNSPENNPYKKLYEENKFKTLSTNVKTYGRLTEKNCLGAKKQAFKTGAKCVASAVISAGAATYGGLLLAHAAPLIPGVAVAGAAFVSILPWILLFGGTLAVMGAAVYCYRQIDERKEELSEASAGLIRPISSRTP